MNTLSKTTPCTKCLSSFQLSLSNHGIDAELLKGFIDESLNASSEHYRIIEQTLSATDRVKYKLGHLQAALLSSLLARAKATG